MKTFAIFYKEHHTSYKFALITKNQIEEANANIRIELVNLEKETHVEFIARMKKENIAPDIIYFWETESFGQTVANMYFCNPSKEILMKIYPKIHFETYSYDDREEIENTPEKTTYNYKLIDRIIEDAKVLDDKKDYIIANKETIKLETHISKNKYWIEDYLYLNPDCIIVDTVEEGQEILKNIAEKKISMLLSEAEIIKLKYKKKTRELALEIDKLKNIIENL